jgi:hypothetical protein
MPYIPMVARELLVNWKRGHAHKGRHPADAGELNFIITNICQNYLDDNGKNYAKINDIIGALEACKLEFYRRLAAPYEDTKIEENGDVYHA